MLAPRLDAEQIVVMDNLGAHRLKRKVRKLIEVRGAERIYPLAYFLDYNLTEVALAKIKNLLRKAVARSQVQGGLGGSAVRSAIIGQRCEHPRRLRAIGYRAAAHLL